MEVRKVENFTRGGNVEFSALDPYNILKYSLSLHPSNTGILVKGGPDYSSRGIMRDEKVHKVKANSSQEILLEKEGNKTGQ